MKYLLILFLFVSCSNSECQESSETIKILFVGNSLTYTNDLPKLVEDEFKAKGKDVETASIAYPNYGLLDHWDDGKIQELLESDDFNYVVIQQGPSSQEEGREWLIESGRLINETIKNKKTSLAYFMVWPSQKYYHTFEGVIRNHTDASRLNNAILLPVGKVWKEYFDKTNDFSYYGSDGFHPSITGSAVAAEVIVGILLNHLDY